MCVIWPAQKDDFIDSVILDQYLKEVAFPEPPVQRFAAENPYASELKGPKIYAHI